MKIGIYFSVIVTSFILVLAKAAYSEDYLSKLEVELKPTYHCVGDHLHIPGIIKNKSNLTLRKVKVEGWAYGEKGNLISSTSSLVGTIAPGKTAPFDLEFLDITGPVHAKVKSYDVKVIEAEKVQTSPYGW